MILTNLRIHTLKHDRGRLLGISNFLVVQSFSPVLFVDREQEKLYKQLKS